MDTKQLRKEEDLTIRETGRLVKLRRHTERD